MKKNQWVISVLMAAALCWGAKALAQETTMPAPAEDAAGAVVETEAVETGIGVAEPFVTEPFAPPEPAATDSVVGFAAEPGVVAGFPDIINCSADDTGAHIWVLYQTGGGDVHYRNCGYGKSARCSVLRFDRASGAFSKLQDSGDGSLKLEWCEGKSVSDIKAAGRARYFSR